MLCRPYYGDALCGEVIEAVRRLRTARSLAGLTALLTEA
jgi:hypothetical protein